LIYTLNNPHFYWTQVAPIR